MLSDQYLHKGWVFKQSEYLKKWRKRYMVVSQTHIATYESEDLTKTPTCTLFSKYCRGIKTDEDTTKKQFGFKVDYDGRDFLFYVENADDLRKWLNVIGKVIVSDLGPKRVLMKTVDSDEDD